MFLNMLIILYGFLRNFTNRLSDRLLISTLAISLVGGVTASLSLPPLFRNAVGRASKPQN